jgi:hypothetical protein
VSGWIRGVANDAANDMTMMTYSNDGAAYIHVGKNISGFWQK